MDPFRALLRRVPPGDKLKEKLNWNPSRKDFAFSSHGDKGLFYMFWRLALGYRGPNSYHPKPLPLTKVSLLGFLVFEKMVVTKIFYKKRKSISFCVSSFSIFLKFISFFFYQGEQKYPFLGYCTHFY